MSQHSKPYSKTTTKKTKLSVVLATHNEEKNLAACLQAVADLADEIIITDGESTDTTIEIAKSFGARVITTTNKPNFHINKQMAMDAATNSLVLQLDADEIVDPELSEWIQTLMKTLDESPERVIDKAWYIKRKNYFLGSFMKKGGQYPDAVIRLYRNGYAKLPQKDVHEQMVVEGSVGETGGHLLHYSSPTFSIFLRKWNDYTSLKATQLLEAGLRPSLFATLRYIVWLPSKTFFLLYLRHKGFLDGMSGFMFALMSGLYHAVSYLKLWELTQKK